MCACVLRSADYEDEMDFDDMDMEENFPDDDYLEQLEAAAAAQDAPIQVCNYCFYDSKSINNSWALIYMIK